MTRTVDRGDVRLAVHEQGPADAPVLLLVHGYPDSSAVWGPVAQRLSERWRVVRPDVRGHGASTAPSDRAGYRLAALAGDLVAVADAVSPQRPVHLVGHDWGAIQSWEAVWARPDRFATFTSISGPCLDHVGHWLRRRPRGPVLAQFAKSWYVGAFQLPVLPEQLWRRALAPRWPYRTSPGLVDDAVRGLELYRANVATRARTPRERPIGVPVQLVLLGRDRYVSPAMARSAEPWVADLRCTELDAGHWAPLTHPDAIATAVEPR